VDDEWSEWLTGKPSRVDQDRPAEYLGELDYYRALVFERACAEEEEATTRAMDRVEKALESPFVAATRAMGRVPCPAVRGRSGELGDFSRQRLSERQIRVYRTGPANRGRRLGDKARRE
jgi:hypothetical protein